MILYGFWLIDSAIQFVQSLVPIWIISESYSGGCHWSSNHYAGLMLGRRRRRQTNIKSTLGQRPMFAVELSFPFRTILETYTPLNRVGCDLFKLLIKSLICVRQSRYGSNTFIWFMPRKLLLVIFESKTKSLNGWVSVFKKIYLSSISQ